MAIKPGLRVSQTQRLALTPALRQSITVLGLSASELGILVAEELEQNPLLLLEQDRPFQLRTDYQFALETIAQEPTLAENLRRQITFVSTPRRIKQVASYLAGDLTDQGFLSDTDSAIAEMLGIRVDLVRQAISLLQSCEPTGIAARDLAQCLDLQLVALGETDVTRQLIVENLGLFADNNWSALRQKSGRSLAELQGLARILQSLDPYPAASVEAKTAPVLHPDVRISPLPGGDFSVDLIGSVTPSLRVDQNLFDTAKTQDPASLDYLQSNAQRASALIRAIEARSKTILRISRQVVLTQHRFFTLGHSKLIPQTQAQLADLLDLHPSTVTRAVANKALICPLGVFPLKFFFTSSLNSMTGDNPLSAYVVQQEIRKLINTETPSEILSDAQIATLLRQSGVDIARRTVAKYRQCLNIPSSAQRRRSKRIL